jgi:deoxyribodipyrimidine photo-lyase
VLGRTYPSPIVDLKASTEAAKTRIYGARKGRAFHEAADAIQNKHGSRRSGLPMTGRRRSRRTVPDRQLDLDL